jgi:signal transduction histidine kinase
VTTFSRWALVSVVVAAAVLAAVGWISLRQWERSAAQVVREQARDTAAMAAEKIEMVLRDVPDDVIARLRYAAGARDIRPDALEAVVADPAVREILEKTLGGLEPPTILALLDPQDRPVYARESIARAQRLASARLREGLPDWQIALYQPPGFVPHQPVRQQVMLFTTVLGILLLVILAGSVTTYRLMRRESEVARLKADFVANVSHDLKTPLSVIRMFGETLELGRVTDPAQRQEYYRVITRESERLSRLIDNVLDFSRIEGGRRTYERAPAPVEPLVRESLEPFAYPLARGGFKVEVDVAPDLPDVTMDAAAIGQALSNLIDNAIKYSGERRALRVAAALVGGELALSVSDDGIGIPPDEHARIFEKFYRVGHSDTQGRRGSGVGLALVRHVAEAHHGRVTVESRPGTGSRFTILLPVR